MKNENLPSKMCTTPYNGEEKPFHLVCTGMFGDHVRGDVIYDPKEINEILSGHGKNMVVKKLVK